MSISLSKITKLAIAGVISSALCFSTLATATPLASDKDKVTKSQKAAKDKIATNKTKSKSKLNATKAKTKAKASSVKKKTNKKSKAALNKNVRVNINNATEHQLMASLNGIGKKKAQAIVKYRNKHGKFKSIDDLSNVKGIGDKLVAKNKSKMHLSGKTSMPDKAKMKKKVNKSKKNLKDKAAKAKASTK